MDALTNHSPQKQNSKKELKKLIIPIHFKTIIHVTLALHILCCFALFVCLTLLASFFLPSHLSFKNMYMYISTLMYHTALKMGTSFSQKFSKISSFLLKTGTYMYMYASILKQVHKYTSKCIHVHTYMYQA